MTILPSEGGSYRREKDGSLTRLDDAAAPVASESETPADAVQTETSPDENDTTDSGKKGKA